MRRLAFALALMLIAPWCFAQGRAGSVELTPFAGYWFGDTLSRGTTGSFDFDVTIDDAPGYGLRLGYRFSENWALEGMLMRSNSELVTGADELFGGRDHIADIDVTAAELGFEGSFGHQRLVPFFAGGIGAVNLDPDLAGMDAETRFAGHLGAGFKLFFTQQFALRFDARYHAVNVGDRSDDCDWWHDCDRNDEWIGLRELSLGLTFVL